MCGPCCRAIPPLRLRWRRPTRSTPSRPCTAAPRASWRERPPDWTYSCWTHRISSIAPATRISGRTAQDWPDNPQRFAALARVAADIGLGAVPGWVPGAVHCHDWQTGWRQPIWRWRAGRDPGR